VKCAVQHATCSGRRAARNMQRMCRAQDATRQARSGQRAAVHRAAVVLSMMRMQRIVHLSMVRSVCVALIIFIGSVVCIINIRTYHTSYEHWKHRVRDNIVHDGRTRMRCALIAMGPRGRSARMTHTARPPRPCPSLSRRALPASELRVPRVPR
jgi:hypothetical protein